MVSRKTLLVVACAAMLVLAGCNGGTETTSPGDTETSPDDPGTETETTTESGDDTGFDSLETPEWMRADGVDGERLLAAHFASLDGESYRAESRQNSTGLLSLTRTQDIRVGEDGTAVYDVQTETSEEESRLRAHVSDSRVVLEQSNATRSVYSNFEYDGESPLNNSQQLQEYVRLGDYEVNRTFEADGETRIEYVATGASDVQGAESISEFKGRIVVSTDGRIYDLDVNATQEADYGDATSEFEYSLVEVGGVDVSEPSWVDTAREEATTVDLEYSFNGSVIKIEHLGGDTVEEGARFVVSPSERRGFAFVELEADFSEGETLYLAADGGRELLQQKGSAPEATGDLGSSIQLSIYGEFNEIVVQSTIEQTTNGSVDDIATDRPGIDSYSGVPTA